MDLEVAGRRLAAEWEHLLEARDAVEHEQLGGAPDRESGGDFSPAEQHQADNGSAVFEREKDLSIREQIDADLRALEDAFARLRLGTYGRCETCGVPIPDVRLVAVPTARFCVEHERLWELHSMSVSFPDAPYPDGGASAEHFAEHEAIQHFEFLADDDEIEPEVELCAEEAAVHPEPAR